MSARVSPVIIIALCLSLCGKTDMRLIMFQQDQTETTGSLLIFTLPLSYPLLPRHSSSDLYHRLPLSVVHACVIYFLRSVI